MLEKIIKYDLNSTKTPPLVLSIVNADYIDIYMQIMISIQNDQVSQLLVI